MDAKTRYQGPKRFVELDLKLKLESPAARQRLIERLQNEELDTLDLAQVMIPESLQFPPHAELPVSTCTPDEDEMVRIAELAGDDKVVLTIDYSIEEWVHDRLDKETLKLKDLPEDIQAQLK